MKHTKKWVAITLVCSQLLSAIPVTATEFAPVENSESITQQSTNEVADMTEPQPEEPATTPETPTEEIPTDSMTPDESETTVPETTPEGPEVTPPSEEPQPEEPETTPPSEEPSTEDPETVPSEEPKTEVPTTKPSEEVKPETPKPKPSEKPKVETPKTKPSPQPVPTQNSGNQQVTAPEVSTPTPVQQNPNPTIPGMTEPKESTIRVSPTKNTWEFIERIGDVAREVGQKEDLYASVMIAQAILESGGGQSQLSQAPYFNLFGIKGFNENKGASFLTQEDDGSGNLYTITSTFRVYKDYEESLTDYAKLLKEGLPYNKEFYKGTWKSETKDYKEATAYLTGKYATDTQYDQKLNAIIEAYALAAYDHPKVDVPEGSDKFILPVQNPVLTSGFGERWGEFHRGIDFAVSIGTPVVASQSGTVIRSEYHYSWGNYVAIKHENGLTTLYAHNSALKVSVGDVVKQGETIAYAGSTGNSTGPHVHFEVSSSPSLAQDQLINPMDILTR
ncbi:peptidoglycan DD-metalloendopeptidase family protein [Candidatus Enterococcus willemsii]|uniref:Mannosyl-glycoprotein endo-beta-N-acetylglucosamidase-like domain-containing protein n=1 Tax=Candidatus Enterococcus willemsii TaxID=1857215 RepID=A0ABQ6YYG7_9ENTE|nr:peptidoglycan DD-metalloendopeptidase family protein [Enterococcus sp. CU12B]KAF1303210.1 hypothetical protein BAU17_08255 [Enterococcus sp. CU12B]